MVQVEASTGHLFSSDGPWFYGLTWLVYVVVAVVTGLLFLRIGELSLLVPLAALVIVLTFMRKEV